MLKILPVLAVFLLVSVSSACTSRNSMPGEQLELQQTTTTPPLVNEPEAHEDFTASFGITTNGTERIFTSPMYHNQSPDVYIELPDPSIVNVKAPNITWDMFFKTLPFTVEKVCLVTGTKQTFCSNQSGTLRFFVNNVEDPDALDRVIQPNDSLEITY